MKSFLSESGYIFDQQAAVWKRADYAGIAYSDGAEVEQRMLDAVRATNELGSISPELALKITDWPSLYHFSSRRANLLRPFEHLFRAGRHVLEVGSGCGAITRFLGECGGDIIALEGSLIRATTTAARCRDLANVAVIADAFDKVAPRPQFDVVTLVGVLEYARKYFPAQGGDPVDALLRHAQSFLKPGGVLIVAIENQLGIKYFAGAAEDHLGVSMYGIEDRYNDASPVTFGKQELRSRLERAGLAAQDWWFPFPDYKLPTSVVSEEGLKGTIGQQLDALLGSTFEADAQLPRHPVFLLDRAWKPVVRNGMGADLANSFLVFAGRGTQALPKNKRKEVAYHFSADRKPEFAKSTVFSVDADERITTCQIPVFPKLNGESTAPIQIHRDTRQPFIEGKLWLQELKAILTHDGWTQSEFNDWVKRWFAALLEQANLQGQEAQLTNNYLLPGSLIDAIPRNLIVTPDGKSVFFDQEYSLQLPLELGFMLFRGIYGSLLCVGKVTPPSSGTPLHGVTLFKDAAQSIGLWLTEADLSRYIAFENDFQIWVTGQPCHYKLEDALAFSLDIRLPLDRRQSREEQLADNVRENAELRARLHTLNQAVSERDGQIAGLNQAVSERDGQIAGLSQAVSERDGQIAGLSQAVSERDGQIAGLSQAVMKRGGQIVDLNQAVTERDGQIASLSQAVTERDIRISEMLQSRSWRLTRPLRGIGSGIRVLRRALNRLFGRMPLIRQARIRRIRQSPLFDADFYAERNPDVVAAGVDLAKHYALSGWKEYRNPSAEFSTRRYLEANPDVAIAGINPLLHYIDRGQAEGRPIHCVEEEAQIAAIRDSGLFDANYYLATYPDIQPPPQDPIRHYCERGWREGRNPSAEFDTQGYLAAYNDVKDAEINPLWHYVVFGRNESRYANLKRIEAEVEAIRASGLFDVNYYFAMYLDIQPAMDPIRHYCEYGWHEGRNPSEGFDTQGYLAAYADIRGAGTNPFWHYVVLGRAELRHANPKRGKRIEAEVEAILASGLFDADYYLATYPDIQPPIDPVRHYCMHGWREGRNPSEEFDTRYYVEANRDIKEAGINPLLHYIKHGITEGRQVLLRAPVVYGTKSFPSQKRILEERREIATWGEAAALPRFSILTPLYNTSETFLREMIESVLAQTYENWELCLADGSDDVHSYVERIVREYMVRDNRSRPRIVYKRLAENKGISENTNACLAMAGGNYIGLLDHDDFLHPEALYLYAKEILDRGADFLYSDEAKFCETINDAYEPFYKPDFSPDYLRTVNYICHLTVFSRKLYEQVGGFRKEFDGSQDYDMVLRLTEKAQHIVHVPKVLYYWRAHAQSTAQDVHAKDYCIDAAKRALAEHLKRVGLKGTVEDSSVFGWYRMKYEIVGEPLVSIIIPNKDNIEMLKRCIDSILLRSSCQNFEIIVVENNSEQQSTFQYYETLTDERISVVKWDGEFNYPAINNFGASFAKGEYILLLNNDTEVIAPDWLQEMLMFAQRKDVGAVGAKLYYPDDTVQHAGVILGVGGVAGHSHKHFSRKSPGYFGRLVLAQNLSAVTAACMMMPKTVFDEVGGLDEAYKVAFNDVDLCMKIRKAGYLIVYTPYAELYHYESVSRGYEDTPEKVARFNGEIRRFMDLWGDELSAGDPCYNENLSLEHEDFRLRI